MRGLKDLGLHVRSRGVESGLRPLGIDLPRNSKFGRKKARHAEGHQDTAVLDKSGELGCAGQTHSTPYVVCLGVFSERLEPVVLLVRKRPGQFRRFVDDAFRAVSLMLHLVVIVLRLPIGSTLFPYTTATGQRCSGARCGTT